MYGYAPDTYTPGTSLRAWRDYFPDAQIYGADLQPDTQFSDDRIRTYLCDSTSCQSVKELWSEHLRGVFFDVIVDDGSHRSEDQLETLSNFYPMLRNGGFYFIEDIGESKDLYRDYRLISPFVGCANYFEISDHDPVSKGRWKMIVIQKTSD